MSSTLDLLQFAASDKPSPSTLAFDGADLSPEGLAAIAGGPEWKKPLSGGKLSFAGRFLQGASLRSANLPKTDFGNADLSKVSAGGASFHGARIEGTRFFEADLVNADLSSVLAGEADFSGALLEDAIMRGAQLRFADFTNSTLDGADLSNADLWGTKFHKAIAERIQFHRSRLDESSLIEAEFVGANFSEATLRRADMAQGDFRNADFRDAVMDGANMAGANLKGALLSNISLITCNLTHAFFSGAWLERTRLRADQIGGAVGEEVAGDLEGAIDSYLVLERNFLSLGSSQEASWAYLKRRKVQRRLHERNAKNEFGEKQWLALIRPSALWIGDLAAEWLCNYGESLYRVARSFLVILLTFAALYWVTGSLRPREGFSERHLYSFLNYLLFSLDSMTTVGTSEIALRPSGELGTLLSSLQTVLGTVLLGLFGFVLGARIRS